MILTGKAKDDFSQSYNMSNFNDYSETLKNTLIIEWFDSVGIKILPCFGLSGWYCEVKDYNNKEFGNYKCFLVVKNQVINDFETRQQATTEAIKKANEIYNNDKI